jgi:membrane-associated phospholipid phosphatase
MYIEPRCRLQFVAHYRCGIKMKQLYWLIFIIGVSAKAFAQDSAQVPVSFGKLFYRLDKNIDGSVTCNYGLNYALAGVLTYGLVKGGVDWKWFRYSNEHNWISNTGFVSVAAGGLVPLSVPLGVYLFGRFRKDTDLQITGLALGQAALLGLGISSGIKVFTGRVPPENDTTRNDYSEDFRFGFFRGGAFEGWPSSHATVAFAMAAAFNELYPRNFVIKAGTLTYAGLIALGVSTNIHWLSDSVAGGLIGFCIGTTVGRSYRNLMCGTPGKQPYQIEFAPNGARLSLRL